MTGRWPADRTTRWCRRFLRWAAVLAPADVRAQRRMEWEAELWQLRATGARAAAHVAFLSGVLWDALWARKEEWSVDSVTHDVRYAWRTLRRSPGFMAAAVVTLALSIGASTALFSMVETAVFGDPPYPDPDRLVVVDMLFGASDAEMAPSQWSWPRYVALREDVTAFEDVAGYGSRTMTLTESGAPSIVSAEVATPSLFRVLGVSAQRGRVFGPGEDDAGSAVQVALVSDAFWRTRMGSDPGAVGDVITLDRLRFEVVGVVEPGYAGLSGSVDVWIPFPALRALESPGALEDAWNQYFRVIGRLSPDATRERARSEVAAFGASVMERFPPPAAARQLESSGDVVPLGEARVNAAARTSMVATFAAVVLVLLIATANLAGLMLARGLGRRREAAVRAALGASRARLVRQRLGESIVLAFIGGAGGVAVARIGVGVLGAWLADSLGTGGSRGLQFVDPGAFAVDWRVFLFALAVTAGVGLAFGLLPALHVARTDASEWLRGGRATTGVRRRVLGIGGRDALLAGQVVLAVVLLSAASLMMRTVVNLQRVDLGFDPDHLLTAVYSLSPADEQAGVRPAVFHDAVLERLSALPGITAASIGEVPMGGPVKRTIVMESEGRPDITLEDHFWIRTVRVAPGHLEMMGASLIEGRDIAPGDDENAGKVVVLGRAAAGELFPDGSPLGRHVKLPWPGYDGIGATVVGVVEDLALDRPGQPPDRLVVLPMRQAPAPETGLLIRVTVDPGGLIPAVRSAMAEIAPNVALTSVMSMRDRLATTNARPRVLTLLLGFFGSVALLLVAIGLYGSIAQLVAERTRELGLRSALGAGRLSIAALVVRQGVGATVAGVVLGVGASAWATTMLEGLVYGTRTVDPMGLAAVSGILLCVAVGAAWLPARRGMRVDPVVALKVE